MPDNALRPPAEPTAADFDYAADVLTEAELPQAQEDALLQPLAQAIADARAAAHAPVLALADELDTEADVQNVLGADNWKITALIGIADRIRAVCATGGDRGRT